MVEWRLAAFDALSAAELYGLLAARQAVFVVEQRCLYLDADGRDGRCWHLLGTIDEALAAYLRIVPPGALHAEPAIGRVLVTPAFRGRGLGRALMEEGLREAGRLYPGQSVRIAAQAHLVDFYRSLGFVAFSGLYDDDGIPHVDMRRPARSP